MADKEIRGAVLYKGTTYTKGMEEEFEEAIEGDEEVDIELMTEKGAVSGFSGEAPEAETSIYPDSEQKAEILGSGGREERDAKPSRPRKAAKKKAGKR